MLAPHLLPVHKPQIYNSLDYRDITSLICTSKALAEEPELRDRYNVVVIEARAKKLKPFELASEDAFETAKKLMAFTNELKQKLSDAKDDSPMYRLASEFNAEMRDELKAYNEEFSELKKYQYSPDPQLQNLFKRAVSVRFAMEIRHAIMRQILEQEKLIVESRSCNNCDFDKTILSQQRDRNFVGEFKARTVGDTFNYSSTYFFLQSTCSYYFQFHGNHPVELAAAEYSSCKEKMLDYIKSKHKNDFALREKWLAEGKINFEPIEVPGALPVASPKESCIMM